MSENHTHTVDEIKAEQARIKARFEAEKQRLDRALIEAEVDALERRCSAAFNDVANDVAQSEFLRSLGRAEVAFLRAKLKALKAFAEAAQVGEHTGGDSE